MKRTLILSFILLATLFCAAAADQPFPYTTQPIWYQKSAENIITGRLKQYGTADDYGFNHSQGIPLRHSIIGFYDVPYFSKKIRIAVAASVPTKRYDCHACAPKISFFLFETQGNNWVFVRAYINQEKRGTWGVPPNKDALRITRIGEKEYGLWVKTVGTWQGYGEEYASLYHFGSDGVQEIINLHIAEDDSGAHEHPRVGWKSAYHFQPSDKPFYDLIVHTTGLKDGRHTDQTVIYTYNGTTYTATPKVHVKSSLPHSQPQKTISALIERCGRVIGRAVVTLNDNHFSFMYKGDGDDLGLSFTPSHFESHHIYDSMTECDRSGDTLTHCEQLPDATLHYRYDGNEYNVTVKGTREGITYKTWLYNDKNYLYWVEYKNGKIISFVKHRIEKH